MGSPADEPGRASDEPLARPTTVGPFAIAIHDVTVREYAAFVRATGHGSDGPGCDWRNPTYRGAPIRQTPDDPVVCVSWADASAYVAWVGGMSGRPYRLPSEQEWEYAARAGTRTARPWGPAFDDRAANTGADACCGPSARGGDRWLYTSPVGSFPPNAFGLYDMLGDVWQWTADCAEAAHGADCAARIARGGGWFHPPDMARSAARVADDPARRAADIGFRVARDLQAGR